MNAKRVHESFDECTTIHFSCSILQTNLILNGNKIFFGCVTLLYKKYHSEQRRARANKARITEIQVMKNSEKKSFDFISIVSLMLIS